MKWNRKRKVIKYYISKMVYIRTEKNLDFRAGPDMIDVYERRDFECSKEVYEKYPHKKVSCTSACYYREEDTYTYWKDEGYEIVSMEESYEMVKPLLHMEIHKVKSSSKSDIEWAIKALNILIQKVKNEIDYIESETYKYTEEYIFDCVRKLNARKAVLEGNKLKLENILENINNRKKEKELAKQREMEIRDNLLLDVKITCECGATLSHIYNPCCCGKCGANIEKLWDKTAKKIAKGNKLVS